MNQDISDDQLIQDAERRGINPAKIAKYKQAAAMRKNAQSSEASAEPSNEGPLSFLKNLAPAVGDALVVAGGGKVPERGGMTDIDKILLREKLLRERPVNERPVDAARRGKLEQEKEFLDRYLKGGVGDGQDNLPPGTTLRAGPLTIPMNPKLTESEQAAISSLETFEPQVENMGNQIKEGAFTPGGGIMSNLKRTAEQFAVDQPGKMGRLMTSMSPKLQGVQSDLNSIRRYAFGEGGKNLTVNEKEIVNALLEMTGKQDDQIIQDHQKALGILRSKAKLALGGANAANAPSGDQSGGGSNIPEFNSEAEAEAAGLQPGQRVKIAGVTGVWE